MKTETQFTASLAKSPILWGGLASVGFYGAIHAGLLTHELVVQYFAGHPVEYVTTAMFFVGLAALIIKAIGLAVQPWRHSANKLLLGPIARGGQSIDTCESLLGRLEALPWGQQNAFLVGRLHGLLERIRRRGSAEGIEDDLKYAADLEADRIYESYALFRVVLWAIPILGFLGTVIGITLAIANLSPTAVEDSLPATIAALSVAFATTTQALSLSIVLMFAKLLTGQAENHLFAQIDRWTDEELLGRFEQISDRPEGHLLAVRRMGEAVIGVTEQLVERQAELWQHSMAAAQEQWGQLAHSAGQTLENALVAALNTNIQSHAERLAAAERETAIRGQKHYEQIRAMLTQSAESNVALQQAVNQQIDILRQTVEATGQVAKLEETLNRNLSALAGARNFEQTVMSLAAAIHLLNNRLEAPVDRQPRVQLETKKSSNQAA